MNIRPILPVLLLVGGIVVALSISSSAATWYVAVSGSDDSGSGSFGAPFACIDYAAAQAVSGDTIEVRPGLYADAGNRELLFSGKSLTIISSDGPEATVIDCEGSTGTPRRALTFDSGIDSTFKVVGITFKNGFATNSGGIIYIDSGSSPLFENCRFELGEAVDGGAVYLHENAGGIFRDCTFNGNNSDNLGGAVFIEAGSNPKFENCEFIGNTSDSYGGALMVGTGSEASFVGSLFADGDATWGGGVMYASGATVTFENCTLVKSAATWSGDILAFSGSNITITNSLIYTTKGSEPVVCLGSSSIDIDCTNIYSTQYSGWFGCVSPQYSSNGNTAVDPLFVDYASNDFRLQDDSPCHPDSNSCGVLIGSEEILQPADDCGDLNLSGQVTITDAVYGINFIFSNGPAPADSRNGDVNCSGGFSITDCVYLVNYIFSYGPIPCSDCQ